MVAEKQPFEGVENSFTNGLLYEDILEASEDVDEENYDNENEVDYKLEPTKDSDFEYEINLLILNLEKLDVSNIADETSEWIINDNIDFAYVSIVPSDFVPSCTSTEADSMPEL